MKRMFLAAFAGLILVGAGALIGAAGYAKPKSIVHVVTVKWKAESTPAQQKAALDGVEKMAAAIPGMKNIWTKTVKVQGDGYNAVFAMEFESADAFKLYADHAAHKEWEKVYLLARGESTTHDVSN